MRFADFTLAIGRCEANGYGVTALGTGLAPVAGALPRPPVSLTAALNRAAGRRATQDALGKAGALLFDWAFPPPMRSQLRAVRARAEAAGEGLRLRLSLDPPELAAWPWELLHDTDRHDTFAASAATPLVRIYERADRFGAVTEMGAELPIDLLLVLPTTANLDLDAPGSPAGPGADRETAGCAHGGIGKSRPVRSWENLTGPARFRTTRASQTAASRPRTTRAPPP